MIQSFIEIVGLFIMALAAAILSQPAILPFLSITCYNAANYAQLVPACRQLYTDLIETNPEDLLDLTKPAFKFTSIERYNRCKWKDDILSSLASATENNREEVVHVIRLYRSRNTIISPPAC